MIWNDYIGVWRWANTPYEFYRLDLFYQATIKIISIIKDNKTLRSILADATLKNLYRIKYNTTKNTILKNYKIIIISVK